MVLVENPFAGCGQLKILVPLKPGANHVEVQVLDPSGKPRSGAAK